MRIDYDEYGDDHYPNAGELWWANVRRCMRGKRGRSALIELRDSLIAMPEKRLIADALIEEGEVCAIGALFKSRVAKTNDSELLERMKGALANEEDTAEFARREGLPKLMAWATVQMNDYELSGCTPEERYERMLKWVNEEIVKGDHR